MIQNLSIKTLLILLSAMLLVACSDNTWKIENAKTVAVGAGDSIFYISNDDEYEFTIDCNQLSLFREDIALFGKDKKFGYIDDDGEVILPNVYKYATSFKDNIAWVVREGDSPGIINSKGELKYTLREIDWVEIYIDDMARYYATENRKKRYGFANREGEKVVQPIYYDATFFSEGLAAVKGLDEKWGYIDKSGVVILPANYDGAKIFINERAAVSVDEKWGVINKLGEYIIEPQFDDLTADGEFFIALSEEKWGWIDIEGKWVVDPVYEKVLPFNGADVAPVLIDGKWAYINNKGEVEIKRQFDEAYPFVKDLALVKIGDYYGFINDNGVYKINPQYTYVSADYISNAIYSLPFYSSVKSDR